MSQQVSRIVLASWAATASMLLAGLQPTVADSVDKPDATGLFPSKPGEWEYRPEREPAPRGYLGPAAYTALVEKMDGIMAVLAQPAVVHPPMGFQARARARYNGWVCRRGESSCDGGPASADLTITFYYFVADENGQPVWGGEASSSISLIINDPAPAGEDFCLEAGHASLPDGRRICGTPQEITRVAGVPLYLRSGGGSSRDGGLPNERTIIARPGVPVWVPVSRQEYLEAMLRARDKELAELRQLRANTTDPYSLWLAERPQRLKRVEESYLAIRKMDPAKAEEFRQLSDRMEAEAEARFKAEQPTDDFTPLPQLEASTASLREELARMSAAERASQAQWANPANEDLLGSGLVPPGRPDAPGLVALNPQLVDRSRPPEEIQVISVTSALGGSWVSNEAVQEFMHSVDWSRVAPFVR